MFRKFRIKALSGAEEPQLQDLMLNIFWDYFRGDLFPKEDLIKYCLLVFLVNLWAGKESDALRCRVWHCSAYFSDLFSDGCVCGPNRSAPRLTWQWFCLRMI